MVTKKEYFPIIEQEPIDILIKYIDFKDPNLNREGIKQIKKDEDNGELKYSLRSIFKFIPWIRKIFILMPNEKVSFLKSPKEINEKIIYVKDKDLLGFDSESSTSFQYALFKLRNFGITDNFILMDDDYFIAKPINKDEMFYEEDGEIYPALITSDYYEMNKDLIIQQLNELKKKKQSDDPHSPIGFYIIQKNSLLFLYKICGNDDIRYGKKLIEPAFSHNAIPMKISDIEEIHDYIRDYYDQAKIILFSKERSSYDLQYQTLYWAYVKNKYNRRSYKISSEFYDLSQAYKVMGNTKRLFVLNTSSRNYNQIFYIREKEVLEKLFPTKTKYELENDDKDKETKIEQKNNKNMDLILNLFVNEVNKRFKIDVGSYLKNVTIKKNENRSKEIDYKAILLDEIKFMKNQCYYQELFNYICTGLFIFMILFRYFQKR